MGNATYYQAPSLSFWHAILDDTKAFFAVAFFLLDKSRDHATWKLKIP